MKKFITMIAIMICFVLVGCSERSIENQPQERVYPDFFLYKN